MRKILNLSRNANDIMNTVVKLSRKYPDYLPIYRGEEAYTVKFRYPEGVAVIDVMLTSSHYKFSVREESSILKVGKPSIPSFEVGLSLTKDHLIYHSRPKSSEAQTWLNSILADTHSSRADSLVIIATTCEIIWSQFMFAFNKKVSNGVVEYNPCEHFEKVATEHITEVVLKKKREHRFDGWDVVNLTGKQLIKIGGILESHQIKHDFDNVALPKFCLSLFDNNHFQYFFATYTGNNLHFEIEDDLTTYTAHCDISLSKTPNNELSLELQDNTNAMTWLTHTSTSPDGEEVAQWQWMVDMFFSINSFMLHFGDVSMEVEEKVATQRSEGTRQSKHNQRNSVRIFKSYKLIRNWTTKARKKAEITCPAWGVRGHYRHYRNGKTIFIESYIKGREKAKYEGKEYALLPYKDT